MMQYKQFAYIYDHLMREAPYEKWRELLQSILNNKHNLNSCNLPNKYKIADIGCGTGEMSLYASSLGYEVYGVDLSEEMLIVAEQKQLEQNIPARRRVKFLCQNMMQLKLPVQVDVVISLFDSLNYLQNINDLEQTIKSVRCNLKENGLFFFDMLSLNKVANLIANKGHFEVSDEVICIWQNDWDQENKLLHYDVSFLINEDGDLYRRFDEYHTQRIFAISEVRDLLRSYNFEILNEFADFDFTKKIDDATDRNFWVVRKRTT